MMGAPLRLGVLASGRGSDLQSLIDARKDGRIESTVAVVVSDQSHARALDRARAHDIPAEALEPQAALAAAQRRREHEGRITKVLAHYKVDLVILAGYMRLVSGDLCKLYPQRLINIHPSLLPAFPGLHAQRQALDWGARFAGCTTHFVDEQTDHGPIVLQAVLPVLPTDDEESLSRRILQLEHQILPRTVHLLEQGRVRVQDRRVLLDPDESWTLKHPTIPGASYSHGY